MALSVLLSAAGALNAIFPISRAFNVNWSGPSSYRPSIKIALVSDIHLGKLIGPGHLKRIAGLIDSRSPDIILIAGDTIDDRNWLRSDKRRNEAADILSSLKPRLGIWAVLGNHDYYSGIEESIGFLESCGIHVLRDEWASPGGELLLAGRDDLTVERLGKERESLHSIISRAFFALGAEAGNLPVVVLDHQPHNLRESAEEDVALQLSGHTHRGQLFPVNFIVSAMYEKHYGLYRKNRTLYYITSGAGTWGPPVRTIGRPEVVFINLNVD
jgi:predicted MPP superfamily phosphohydrolase